MIYQTFVLDESKQKKIDKERGSIDSERGKYLIRFLKDKLYIIFISNSTYAGIHTIIMVGAELDKAENIKEDFYKIATELGLFFISGAFFTEAI